MGKENPNPIIRGVKAIVRSRVGQAATAVAVLGLSGVDINCGKPATEVRPTATPAGIGYKIGDIADPRIKEIAERLSDKTIEQPVSEEDILAFNAYLGARASNTATAATAEAQKPKVLPEIITAETITKAGGMVTLPAKDVRDLQKEAADRGEVKIPIPKEVIDAGGKITVGEILPTGARLLSISVPSGTNLAFSSPIEGKVIKAQTINAATNLITIESGSRIWSIYSPRVSVFKVKVGDSVSLGTLLLEVSYNPNDPTQQAFEKQSATGVSGEIVQIANGDKQTNKPDELSLLSVGNYLRTTGGELITVS